MRKELTLQIEVQIPCVWMQTSKTGSIPANTGFFLHNTLGYDSKLARERGGNVLFCFNEWVNQMSKCRPIFPTKAHRITCHNHQWKISLTFIVIPVGLWRSWTQLLLLLTFWPPGPQPLMNFSSKSSSLRCILWYKQTKFTAPCNPILEAVTKCSPSTDICRAILVRPFHVRVATQNISYFNYFRFQEVS